MLSLILSFLIITAGSEVGTAGFNFLKIAPSAKEAAMGNASIGLESNSSWSGFGLCYNPATNIRNQILGVGYLNYVAGINLGAVSYSKEKPVAFLNSGGIAISYLNSGKIKRTDINGNELGTFTVSYLNLNPAGNITLMKDQLTAGLGLKLLYGAIDSFYALAMGIDLGVRYKPTVPGLTVGAVVRNFGYQIKAYDAERDKLPLDIGIGAGYTIGDNINFAFDIHKPIDNTVLFNLGAEGWFNKHFSLRAGYNSLGTDYRTSGTSDITAGFSVGLGIKHSKYQVDYSVTPMGNLGRLHHISLLIGIGD